MKKITFIILLVTAFISNAQDVSIIKSEIFKDSKKASSLRYSLDDGNGGLVTIRAFYGGWGQNLKGYYIQHFDTQLKLLNETEYEADHNTAIRNAFIKDNQLHLIVYHIDRKENVISFNAESADLDKLKFSTKKILSFSKENDKKHVQIIAFSFVISNFHQYDSNHLGEVVMSDNNNYFVINFDVDDKDKETHKIFVFNSNFEKTYEQVIQKDIKDKYFEYESIDIDDNDGTVYFLGKTFENNSRKSKKKGITNYHFEIYKVNADGQHHASFKNDDKLISSLELVKFKNRLACIGFYGKKDEAKINGVSLFNLDPNTLKIQKQKFTPFTQQFLTDKYGNNNSKKKRKQKRGIKNIDFKNIDAMDNGDIVLNAEEFYITTHTSTDADGGTRTYTVHHFDDIMSLRMDKDGDLKWARNINKRQKGYGNSSYTSITVGEDSYFFINCSDRIKKLSADRIAFKQTKDKKSNLYAIRINNTGDIDFKKLIDDKESKVYYSVNNGNVDLDHQTVILTGKKRKNVRILKLKI